MTDTRESFVAFWQREHDRLYRALALALGDRALAAEAVDEAMARAWQRWDRVRRYQNPAAWVFRVGRNWSVSVRRWRSRRPSVDLEDLDRAVEDRITDVDLYRAVRALPESQRTVVILRFLLDWPVQQVAEALELKVPTVRTRTHRALAALRKAEEVMR